MRFGEHVPVYHRSHIPWCLFAFKPLLKLVPALRHSSALCPCRLDLSFLEFHVNVIIDCIFFFVGLLLFLEVSDISCHKIVPFYCWVVFYSVEYHKLFTHLLVDGQLGCFQFEVLWIKFCDHYVEVFFGRLIFISLG